MVVALSAVTRAEKAEEKNAKLLVGTWEVTRMDEGVPLPVGSRVEFVKDGKVKVTRKKDEVREGTYKFEEGKLIVLMAPNNPNVISIKKITDAELSVIMVESGKAMEFKRKK